MPDPTPAPDTVRSCESIFARWLAQRDAGEAIDIEALCRVHPEQAEELGELAQRWQRVEDLRRAGGPSGSVAAKLAGRFGADVDPKVELEPEGSGDFTAQVLGRLAGRSERSGRYRLKGEVAQGGMGAILRVWDEDLRRHLAMKVVLGKDGGAQGATPALDRQVLARFLEEAQVTGQLDHPGIVPVHELGLDERGRVYFTMKLVKGRDLKAIFALVRERKEGWSEVKALGVLLKVCEAMSYAHDKGVIHRDLKPANVMVGRYGEAYVMDWGLARVLGRADERDIRVRAEDPTLASGVRTDRTSQGETPDSPLLTMDGDVVGTPAYMPPEQAEGRLEAMGPHSDVYALGAMLYHLLAGHMPYVRAGTRASNYAVWRWVKEGPPTPLEEEAPHAAPELIAICERAMAREIHRRYRDMGELSRDLSAYLEGKVVSAYETGTWAETRKWVRRNRPLAASLAAAVLLLVAGLSASLVFKARADRRAQELELANATIRERGEELAAAVTLAEESATLADARRVEAESARAEALKEKAAAQQSAEETKLVADFQSRMLSELSIDAFGRTIVVELERDLGERLVRLGRGAAEVADAREVLAEILRPSNPTNVAQRVLQTAIFEPAVRTIETDYARNPLLAARLQTPLADTLRGLSLYDLAEASARAAVQARRAALGDSDPDTLASIGVLAVILRSQGRYAEAEPLQREALAGRRALLGDRDPETLRALASLGELYHVQGRLGEAEALFREALGARRETLGDEHPDTVGAMSALAALLRARGDAVEAEALLREALAIRRARLGDDHPDTLVLAAGLSAVVQDRGRLDEAEALARETLAGFRARLGDGHVKTLTAEHNLASLLHAQGQLVEAETLHRASLEGLRATLGAAHPDTLSSIAALARLLLTKGELTEAEGLFREVLEGRRAQLGPAHPGTLTALNNLANLLHTQGKPAEAEPLFREGLEGARATLGDDHPTTLFLLSNLATVLHRLGRPDEAEPLLREALEGRRAKLGPAHADTLVSIQNLAGFLHTRGRTAEAIALAREALAGLRAELGDLHPSTLTAMQNLSVMSRAQGDLEGALALTREAFAGFRATLGDQHPSTLGARIGLVELLREAGRHAEAEPLAREALDRIRSLRGDEHASTLAALDALAGVLVAEGKLAEAEPVHLEALASRRATLGDGHADTQRTLRASIALYEAWHAREPGAGHDARAAELRALIR